MDETGIDIAANAAHIANYIRKSYPMVEREDILQEVWLWVYEHPTKVDEYQDGTEHGRNKLLKAMRNAAIRYCQAEKARMLGYRPEDNYFYDVGMIRSVLELIWDEEAWISPPMPEDQVQVKSTRDISEGNNYVTALVDVSSAVKTLPLGEQALLKARYYEGFSSADIASGLDLTISAVDARISRLVKKIQRRLGGERPQRD
jgi:RNA polymerase sigma factor (sigma-70 family)